MAKLPSILVVGAVLTVVTWLRPAQDLPAPAAVQPARHEAAEARALQAELRDTGRVVRRRPTHEPRHAKDAATDVRTTQALEARLARDSRLSALEIEVSTSDGRVTLAGRVDSPSDLLRAIEIAFADSNVQQVVSTLQVSRPEALPDASSLPH